MNIPVMTPQQKADARALAQMLIEKFSDDQEIVRLGFYLLGSLDLIQRLALKADPMAARYATTGQRQHRYPDLVAVGLGHLWVGPGFNDFAPALIEGTQKFLIKRDLPSGRGDAINAARNKVLAHDWGYLEQRHDEGQELLTRAAQVTERRSAAPARPAAMPFSAAPALGEPTEEQKAATRAGLEKLRKQMRMNPGGQ